MAGLNSYPQSAAVLMTDIPTVPVPRLVDPYREISTAAGARRIAIER
jgi:hypothetical protein